MQLYQFNLRFKKYFLCGICAVSSGKLVNHIIPYKTDVNKFDTSPVSFKQYRRSNLREVLMLDMTECAYCVLKYCN